MNTTLADSLADPLTDPLTDPLPEPTPTRTPTLRPGTHVEVRRRFDDAWARGFQVQAVHTDGYQLRRLTDGAILPVAFPASDVRRSADVA